MISPRSHLGRGHVPEREHPQVYALVRSGELPAIKIGGRGVWRVDRKRLDEYLENLETETAAWTKKHPLNPKEKAKPKPSTSKRATTKEEP